MKLVHVALLYLGSATFLGVHAARLDVASDFKRKWTKWALSRAKRDATPPGTFSGQVAAADVQPLIRSQDVKEDPRVSVPLLGNSTAPLSRPLPLPCVLQQPGGCPHPREALPPEHERLPPLPGYASGVQVRDLHDPAAGPPDLPLLHRFNALNHPSR
uniref:Uncharacterized protein n=1 Tax=Gopherus agassizii TaxID=38772 RepID=A0A452IGI9_9SAUR